ncbi:MAG: maleylacetoacetate isomerase [Alphaproteobacteria bacterium]|nr:maleylacetoacetate isomerase [Alphaproteobacteria bacterium]MBL7097490.1 maleylacetoacetate isomerase [Alphaproteobacteria bacterium]
MSSKPDFALYGYFRSSAAFRARIALNLKGIKPELRFIHLLRNGGEQHTAEYKGLNPQELIPALAHDGHLITQSLAIIEYLDEIVPEPPLLPNDALGRARVREIAYAIACDIHPVNNLRVNQHLMKVFGATPEQQAAWQRHWITTGFTALETMLSLSKNTGAFCYGDTPTLADICLIPQCANAKRVRLDFSPFPTIARIEAHALKHPAFDAALPANQPDAE